MRKKRKRLKHKLIIIVNKKISTKKNLLPNIFMNNYKMAKKDSFCKNLENAKQEKSTANFFVSFFFL